MARPQCITISHRSVISLFYNFCAARLSSELAVYPRGGGCVRRGAAAARDGRTVFDGGVGGGDVCLRRKKGEKADLPSGGGGGGGGGGHGRLPHPR